MTRLKIHCCLFKTAHHVRKGDDSSVSSLSFPLKSRDLSGLSVHIKTFKSSQEPTFSHFVGFTGGSNLELQWTPNTPWFVPRFTICLTI
jgi:hypothetical protein